MFDLQSIIDNLLKSPAIQSAMAEAMELRNNIIKTCVRFDARFDALEERANRIIFLLEHPSDIIPAGDDGLVRLLESAKVQECAVVGCTNTAVHDHGDGPVKVKIPETQLTEVVHAGNTHSERDASGRDGE
jgi:hypothetical protein